MATTTDKLETTEFDDDKELRKLYLLLKRARDARTDVQECMALCELSSEALALAKKKGKPELTEVKITQERKRV